MNRFRKLKIVFYLTGIFLAGIVTGVFISFQVARHMMPTQANMTGHWSRQLQSKLDLSPEQMQKIKPLLREAIGGFQATVAADALSSLSNCNVQIATQLTPEQKVKFEQLAKEQREFIQQKLGGQVAPQPKAPGTN
jgi:Spy/CpxP family protein refolding chaperone